MPVEESSTGYEAENKGFKIKTTNIKLIDQYKAFQILSENWETITADLEMIQGEGFDAIFQVDPNMVVKKKKEDEDEVTEVQEGWKGHILPFELVQEEFHHGELFGIKSSKHLINYNKNINLLILTNTIKWFFMAQSQADLSPSRRGVLITSSAGQTLEVPLSFDSPSS